MAHSTNDTNNDDFMTALRARVAAKDAAQDAQFAAIMESKPERPTKAIPIPDWIVKRIAPAKKNTPAEAGKAKRKTPRKPKS